MCNKKYRLGFWDYLRLFWDFLCHRVNKLNVTIAFYVRHDDETRVSTVQSFKSIFEKCGHIVDVKYTEAGWYKFIGRNVPTLAHCLSEVSGNPIVQEGVKIAIFDFDDSLKVAKDAIMFCDTSLGYHSGFYDTVSSASFFRAFYKEIVIGRGVLDTYKRLCRDSLIAPILSEKVSGTRDFVINSNFSRENYD